MNDVNLLFNSSNEIFHHGIEGQKWGVRNGPPYPLDQGNARRIVQERKNKLEKYKEDKSKYGKIYNQNKAKRAIKAGSVAAVSTYGLTKYNTGITKNIANKLREIISRNPVIRSHLAKHGKFPIDIINSNTVRVSAVILAAIGAGALSNLKVQDTYSNQGMQYKHAKENIKQAKKEVKLAEKYVNLATKSNLTDEDLADLSIIKKELKLK